MSQKSGSAKMSSERTVKDIRRATRKQYSAEEKIRIELDGRKRPILPAWIEDSASVSVHDDFNGHYLR